MKDNNTNNKSNNQMSNNRIKDIAKNNAEENNKRLNNDLVVTTTTKETKSRDNQSNLIGYARVSTYEQSLDLQIDALEQIGCKKIYADKVSGAKAERLELSKLKESLREGEIVVVWKLDRMSRSLRDLIDLVRFFESKGVGFRSITENIDTTTPSGKLIFHIFGSMAEFERDLIRERTLAGLATARARGRNGGRPRSTTKNQDEMIWKMYQDKNIEIKTITETFNISKTKLYKVVKAMKEGRLGSVSK
jgi:DNA invertase Pin-like site-specific DNA recombinase